MSTSWKNKKLFVFDLDGTLTPSKSQMDSEMAGLILRLIDRGKKMAVISGGALPQYEKQFLSALRASPEQLKNIFLFPTCGAAFYRYAQGSGSTNSPIDIKNWQLVYEKRITEEGGEKIKYALKAAFVDISYIHPPQIYGELIEHRGTQVTFSALGQLAPLELKYKWDPDGAKRLKLREALLNYIPEFDIKLGGTTSLDITHIGIDKAFGIKQMEKYLGIAKAEMLYFGDRIAPGGNDHPVKLLGVDCVAVSGPMETKKYLVGIITQSNSK